MNNDYYVYVYLNQLKEGLWVFENHKFDYQPFYVGKGRKKREKSHLCRCNLKAKTHKNNTINQIIRETGENPIHLRIFENLTNEDAIKIEANFIKLFGRVDTGTGILSNMTDGGEGVNNFADKNVSKEWARKKVYQYTLSGEFVREWKSIASVDIIKYPSNISTSIKKGGTLGNYIWSYTKEETVKPKDFANVPVFEIKNTHEDFGKIYFEPSKKQGKGGRARKKGKWWL
jgi:hypothetical protein